MAGIREGTGDPGDGPGAVVYKEHKTRSRGRLTPGSRMASLLVGERESCVREARMVVLEGFSMPFSKSTEYSVEESEGFGLGYINKTCPRQLLHSCRISSWQESPRPPVNIVVDTVPT